MREVLKVPILRDEIDIPRVRNHALMNAVKDPNDKDLVKRRGNSSCGRAGAYQCLQSPIIARKTLSTDFSYSASAVRGGNAP